MKLRTLCHWAIVLLSLGCGGSTANPFPGGDASVGPTCGAAGTACQGADQCCSKSCDAATGSCGSTIGRCVSTGGACASGTDCCSLSCIGGHCGGACTS